MRPPILERDTVQYNANLAIWKRIRSMIPAWKDMQDGDWKGFIVESDAVGSALEPFLKELADHWDACASDGWPVWFFVEDDMTEAITTLQTMLTEMQKIAPPRMQCGVTSRLVPGYRDALYDLYLTEIGAGPLDGGCWAFAKAAQIVYGGDLYTLVGTDMQATKATGHHVVLCKVDRFFDADGWSSREELLERWRREEHVDDPSLRPFDESDVPGSPRDPGLVAKTIELLIGEATPVDDAAWDPVWMAFALRHAMSTGELSKEDCRPTDMDAFEKFIEPCRIDMDLAYAMVDDVPHVAGFVQGDYQFWVWDLYPGAPDYVVVIEDAPYAGCYCLPPLSEWPNFAR